MNLLDGPHAIDVTILDRIDVGSLRIALPWRLALVRAPTVVMTQTQGVVDGVHEIEVFTPSAAGIPVTLTRVIRMVPWTDAGEPSPFDSAAKGDFNNRSTEIFLA